MGETAQWIWLGLLTVWVALTTLPIALMAMEWWIAETDTRLTNAIERRMKPSWGKPEEWEEGDSEST